MSSSTWNDTSCKNTSSLLSCQAMRELAMKEAEENMVHMSYLVNDPSCERYHSLADRVKEHSVQATVLNRRLCFTHDPDLKQGTYSEYIPGKLMDERWEEWTRRKDTGKYPYKKGTEIDALIWNNQSNDGNPVTKCGNAKKL
jgi:hypothetical protein